MKMRKLDRKGDISSPIIVILVTVAALAVAGMAIAWMASTGARASSQGSLVVVGTPTVTTGSSTTNTLYITVKNLGNTAVSISSIRLGTHTASLSPPQNIPSGASTAITATFSSSTFNASTVYYGTIVSDAGTLQFSAMCQ